MLEPDCVQFENVQCHDLGACPDQPATGRGLGNAVSRSQSDITGRLDELPESVVISALNASRGNHDLIIMTPSLGSNRCGENSRGKVQNVLADSCVVHFGGSVAE